VDDKTDSTANKRYNDKDTGKFVEGNPGRPAGQKNYLTLLEDALAEQAKKAGKSYWTRLAEYAFTNPIMASNILKKFLPDMQLTEHIDREPRTIIFKEYSIDKADNENGNGHDHKDILLVKAESKED